MKTLRGEGSASGAPRDKKSPPSFLLPAGIQRRTERGHLLSRAPRIRALRGRRNARLRQWAGRCPLSAEGVARPDPPTMATGHALGPIPRRHFLEVVVLVRMAVAVPMFVPMPVLMRVGTH